MQSSRLRTGYVYVLTNTVISGVVKVGLTTRSPREHAKKLTPPGNPEKWEVYYSILVPDCTRVEREVHKELRAFRHTEDREFFKISPSKAKNIVEKKANENIALYPEWANPQAKSQPSVQQEERKMGFLLHRFSLTTILAATAVFIMGIVALFAFGILSLSSSKSAPEKLASDIAELQPLREEDDVEFEFIPAEDMRTKIATAFEENYLSNKVDIKQEIYQMLGLLSEDQNLQDLLFGLYSEMSNSVYEREINTMYFESNKDWEATEKIAFVYEYAYVLQDKSFGLDLMLQNLGENSDQALALLALAKGNATKIESNYAQEEFGINDVRYLWGETALASWEKSVANAPHFITETQSFQYEEGLDFTDQLGNSEDLENIYVVPPLSTEQILHPEKYLNPDSFDAPEVITLPDIGEVLGEGWNLLHTDVVGELMFRAYLETYISPAIAAEAARGWGGDLLEYWKNADNNRLLVIDSSWDTYDDALEFASAYKTLLENMNRSAGGTYHREKDLWQINDLYFRLAQYGHSVLIFIADDEAVITKVPLNRDSFRGDLPQGKISDMVTSHGSEYVYAIDQDNPSLYFLNTRSIEVDRHVSLPCLQPVALSYSADNNNLYIISGTNGELVTYDLNSDAASTMVYSDTEYGLDIEIAPKLSQLYILSRDRREEYKYNEYLTILDYNTGEILLHKQITVPATCEYMAIDEERESLFISSKDKIALYSISEITPKFLLDIEAGVNCRKIVISPEGSRIVLPCGGGNGPDYVTYDFDATNLETVIGEWHIGKYPNCAAFSPDGQLLFATNGNPFDQKLFVLSTSSHVQISTFDFPNSEGYPVICPAADGIAVIGFSCDPLCQHEYGLFYFPLES